MKVEVYSSLKDPLIDNVRTIHYGVGNQMPVAKKKEEYKVRPARFVEKSGSRPANMPVNKGRRLPKNHFTRAYAQ
jgi:hypothetical protein